MSFDEEVFVPTVFTHNGERLADDGLTRPFFGGVAKQAQAAEIASDEYFLVTEFSLEDTPARDRPQYCRLCPRRDTASSESYQVNSLDYSTTHLAPRP